MAELVTRRWPWAAPLRTALEGERLTWRAGRRSGVIALADVASVRVNLAPARARHASVCRIRTKTGAGLTVTDVYAKALGGFERRSAVFEAFTEALIGALALAHPAARLLTGPSFGVWIASSVVLAGCIAVSALGAVLMITQGRISAAALAFMAAALVQLPLLWPTVCSGGPKALQPSGHRP
jgi:hypothetical protein